MPIRLLFVGLSVFALINLTYAYQPDTLQRFEFSEIHMGTQFRLIFYASSEKIAKKAAKKAFAKVAKLNSIMSDYDPASELRKLCAKAGGAPIKVSQELFTILSRAKALSKSSKGAFDPTVGPVSKLWWRSRKTIKLPDDEKLREALARVGIDKMILNEETRTVQLIVEGMLLDLGGIAKGFAADAVLDVLRGFGITRAMVIAGGDVATADAPPGKSGWTVGIGPLRDPSSKPKVLLSLENLAVSTSGDIEQYVVIGGKRYSHIVDPRTGLGLSGRSSVTVVAKTCTESDSLATTVSVLGPKKGLEFLKRHNGSEAYVVREMEGHKLRTWRTSGFNKYVVSEKESQKNN